MNVTARLAGIVLVAAALSACQSQWFLQQEYGDLVTTEVVVRTAPSAAHVSLNGVRTGNAPIRIPIEYHHQDQLWSRQNSYGTRMRQDWHPVLQVLGFPVWGVASLFHFNEEMRRHVYSANKHVVSATLMNHHEASRDIALEGEAEVLIELELAPNTGVQPEAGAGTAPKADEVPETDAAPK